MATGKEMVDGERWGTVRCNVGEIHKSRPCVVLPDRVHAVCKGAGGGRRICRGKTKCLVYSVGGRGKPVCAAVENFAGTNGDDLLAPWAGAAARLAVEQVQQTQKGSIILWDIH